MRHTGGVVCLVRPARHLGRRLTVNKITYNIAHNTNDCVVSGVSCWFALFRTIRSGRPLLSYRLLISPFSKRYYYYFFFSARGSRIRQDGTVAAVPTPPRIRLSLAFIRSACLLRYFRLFRSPVSRVSAFSSRSAAPTALRRERDGVLLRNDGDGQRRKSRDDRPRRRRDRARRVVRRNRRGLFRVRHDRNKFGFTDFRVISPLRVPPGRGPPRRISPRAPHTRHVHPKPFGTPSRPLLRHRNSKRNAFSDT